jgi:hypothetical protein
MKRKKNVALVVNPKLLPEDEGDYQVSNAAHPKRRKAHPSREDF